MVTPICLITCALATAQPLESGEWLLSPKVQTGLELVYTGNCTEEALIPHVVFQRQYRMELHALVLAARLKDADIALLTSLNLRDGRGEKGPRDKKIEAPWSTRLELARFDMQGRLLETEGKALSSPMNGPPTMEAGFLVEFPLIRVSKNQTWDVTEEGRPSRTWVVLGTEMENGVTCIKILGQQQSNDWDKPRADQTAWRRRDTVWINPGLGVAQKVERVTERRDPARIGPTHRTTVQYTLESGLKYRGNLFEDRRHEIQMARKFHEEAAPFLKQPVLFKSQIEAIQRKVSLRLENTTPTPYRKALTHLLGRLESAQKGELPPDLPTGTPVVLPKTVQIGQRVPDVIVSELGGKETTRLHRLLGKPVLIFFYNPAAESSREVLRFVQGLIEKHPGAMNFLAMAVTEDADLACKVQADLKLPFPAHDGKAFHTTFGVDATPRLVLVDAEGIVRTTHTGWGFQSPAEMMTEIRRCLPR